MSLQEKTEAPTDHRRKEARRKGQVGKSIELSSGLAMVSALVTLKFLGPSIFERMRDVFTHSLAEWPKVDLTSEMTVDIGTTALVQAMMILLPILLVSFFVAAIATACQVGLLISGEPLNPQAKRLDPFKGIARMVSKRAAIELVRSFLKITIVGYVIWVTLRQEAPQLTGLANSEWTAIAGAVGEVMWKVVVRASIAILIIGGIDYFIQRHQHEKELKMTKQELKEDLKRSEGDPTTRSRIRSVMRQMSMNRMMSDVAKADVVITNPIHLAVALKYDVETMSAPTVVAKGQRLIAERIKEIAEENGIPVVRNVPLARSLFKGVEIGREVPADLYQAVAEVLAAVFRMKGKTV